MQAVRVPAHDLPAYRVLRSSDLVTESMRLAELPTDALTSTAALSGALALAPLAAGEPITAALVLALPDPAVLSGTVVVAVEGGPALAFGGRLRPGDLVSAWRGAQPLAERALVLEVRLAERPPGANVPDSYLVVLALPADQREALTAAARAQTLSLSITP